VTYFVTSSVAVFEAAIRVKSTYDGWSISNEYHIFGHFTLTCIRNDELASVKAADLVNYVVLLY